MSNNKSPGKAKGPFSLTFAFAHCFSAILSRTKGNPFHILHITHYSRETAKKDEQKSKRVARNKIKYKITAPKSTKRLEWSKSKDLLDFSCIYTNKEQVPASSSDFCWDLPSRSKKKTKKTLKCKSWLKHKVVSRRFERMKERLCSVHACT